MTSQPAVVAVDEHSLAETTLLYAEEGNGPTNARSFRGEIVGVDGEVTKPVLMTYHKETASLRNLRLKTTHANGLVALPYQSCSRRCLL
jgi:hypothetical protein